MAFMATSLSCGSTFSSTVKNASSSRFEPMITGTLLLYCLAWMGSIGAAEADAVDHELAGGNRRRPRSRSRRVGEQRSRSNTGAAGAHKAGLGRAPVRAPSCAPLSTAFV